jgi:hypothetical protein
MGRAAGAPLSSVTIGCVDERGQGPRLSRHQENFKGLDLSRDVKGKSEPLRPNAWSGGPILQDWRQVLAHEDSAPIHVPGGTGVNQRLVLGANAGLFITRSRAPVTRSECGAGIRAPKHRTSKHACDNTSWMLGNLYAAPGGFLASSAVKPQISQSAPRCARHPINLLLLENEGFQEQVDSPNGLARIRAQPHPNFHRQVAVVFLVDTSEHGSLRWDIRCRQFAGLLGYDLAKDVADRGQRDLVAGLHVDDDVDLQIFFQGHGLPHSSLG